MANYTLATPKFTPMTFEDIAKPIAMYNEMYDKAMGQVLAMQEAANPFDTYLNEGDGEVYNLSKLYNSDLNNFADDFLMGFRRSNARAKSLNLRTRYNQVMKPIEEAYNRRAKEATSFTEANIKAGGNLVSDYDPSKIALDNYYKNPTFTALSRVVDGRDVEKEAYTMALALATQIRDLGNKSKEYIDNFHYRIKTSYGYSPGEVLYAIEHPNDINSSPILRKIVEQTMSPYKDWSSTSLDRLQSYALKGLWGAVGKEIPETITDEGRKMAVQAAYNRRSSGGGGGSNGNPQLPIKSPQPKYGQRNPGTLKELGDIKKWREFNKYFYKDKNGRWRMNKDGRDRYKRELVIKQLAERQASTMLDLTPRWMPVAGELTNTIKNNKKLKDKFVKEISKVPGTDFLNFIDSQGLSGMGFNRYGTWSLDRISQIDTNYKGLTDINQYTEKTRDIGSEMYEDVLGKLSNASKDGELYHYDLSSSKGKYTLSKSNKKINPSGMKKDDVAGMIIVYGDSTEPYLEITGRNNEKVNIPLSTIDTARAGLITRQMANAGYWEDVKKGKVRDNSVVSVPQPDGSVEMYVPIVKDGVLVGYAPIDDKIVGLSNVAGDNFMTALGTYKTTDENVKQDFYDVY